MSIIGSILGGGLLEGASKIIGVLKLSPEKRAEFEAAALASQAELRKLELDLEAKAQDVLAREFEAAGANIRAETTSSDRFTSRARPSFLYIVNFIFLWNYVVAPLTGRVPLDLPEPLFWLFGSVLLGYIGGRSWEKVTLNTLSTSAK